MAQNNMIDLNTPVEADDREFDDSLLEKGTYKAKLLSIKDWEPKVYPTFMANVYDSNKQVMRDADNKLIKEEIHNLTIYNTQATLEITEGPKKGRRLFVRLTTNPNTPWDLAKFIKGLGVKNLAPGRIKEFLDTEMEISVDIESYPREDYIDKKTGENIFANSKQRNIVKFYKPIDTEY